MSSQPTVTSIDYEFVGDDLFEGWIEPINTNEFDLLASIDLYAEQVAAKIRHAYPAATVNVESVRGLAGNRISVDVSPDDAPHAWSAVADARANVEEYSRVVYEAINPADPDGAYAWLVRQDA